MWGLLLRLVPVVLGWFGIGSSKSDTQAAQQAGEKQGKAEQAAKDESQIIADAQAANEARTVVRDAPASELRADDGFRRD